MRRLLRSAAPPLLLLGILVASSDGNAQGSHACPEGYQLDAIKGERGCNLDKPCLPSGAVKCKMRCVPVGGGKPFEETFIIPKCKAEPTQEKPKKEEKPTNKEEAPPDEQPKGE
jgi:hypothetical protein